VTTKAQQNSIYQDYLSRRGEDNQLHYDIKIDATRLLLDNTENTFVTPVFNGSASLRNAAGQLIENVTKSVRRGEKVDVSYYDAMYADVTALYRLDQIVEDTSAKEFDGLPQTAVILFVSLALCWIGIGGYALLSVLKKNNKKI
jgi:multiple sugar transport system substrate-binding protein